MRSSSSFFLLSSNSAIKRSPFNSYSLSGLFIFAVFFFYRSSSSSSLSSFYSHLFFSSSSSLLTTMVVVLGFVLLLVTSPLSDSNSCAKWLMLVLRLCPFPSESSNCSMMALSSVASVFQADCCWGFSRRFTLTWQWMLSLGLYLLLNAFGWIFGHGYGVFCPIGGG